MPSTLGPGASDQDVQHELCPTCSVAVTLGADFDLTQQFACGFARELHVSGTGGIINAVLLNDGGTVQSYYVPQGGFLHGHFITVKSTTNGTTATGIVARR